MKVEVSVEEAAERMTRALTLSGVPQEDTAIVVDSLLDAELCGIESHGLMRLPAYIKRIREGLIEPQPDIQIRTEGSILQVNGGNGLGQIVAHRVMRECIQVAKERGCCFAAVSHSNHFGTAAYYTRMAAEEQMLGFACTGAGPAVAPFGGIRRMLGTDPFSVAFPVENATPFVLDAAVSTVAKGKIRVYANEGRAIPDSWAIDRYGNRTTDPIAAIDGSLLPMAGHKGFGMAIAVEAVCSLLSGAKLSCEGESMFEAREPAQTGHFLGALDIAHFVSPAVFEQRAREWFDQIRNSPLSPGAECIMIPGEPEAKRRAAAGNRLLVAEETYHQLCVLSKGEGGK